VALEGERNALGHVCLLAAGPKSGQRALQRPLEAENLSEIEHKDSRS
jgi:hypothetical protein